MKNLKFLKKMFIKIDMYGHRVDFCIDSKSGVQSKFGAFISIIVIIICVKNFQNYIDDWNNGANLQIISSSQNFNVPDFLHENKTMLYELDSTNFNIFFALSAQFQGGTILTYDSLNRYFTQKIYFYDYKGELTSLPFEKCTKNKIKAFLLQSFNASDNSTSPGTLCLNSKIQLGLFPDTQTNRILVPNLSYQIEKCQNTTNNNNSCASDYEIEKILNSVYLQITIPKSIYDYKKYENPRKRAYDYQFYTLEYGVSKGYTETLIPTYLYTDIGIINYEYNLDSVDFNQDNLQVESRIRTPEQDVFFSYSIRIGMNQQLNYRKNDKIDTVFAKLGGMINLVFILGKAISSGFNYLLLKHKLINISFKNLEKNGEKEKKNTFKFSFFSLLCPKLMGNQVYLKALKHVDEYMGIENIIKRLQDIDKLKMILFNMEQRRIFEILPKPGITKKHSTDDTRFTLDSIVRSKKFSDPLKQIQIQSCKSPKKRELNDESDSINQRLFGLMESSSQKLTQTGKEKKSSGFAKIKQTKQPIGFLKKFKAFCRFSNVMTNE